MLIKRGTSLKKKAESIGIETCWTMWGFYNESKKCNFGTSGFQNKEKALQTHRDWVFIFSFWMIMPLLFIILFYKIIPLLF